MNECRLTKKWLMIISKCRLHELTDHKMEIPKIRVKIINEQQLLAKHLFRQIVQCDSLEKPRK